MTTEKTMKKIMKTTPEFRTVRVDSVQVRSDEDKNVVEGYGIVYDQRTEIFPGFYETIKQGAFTESLSKREIKSFFNHDGGLVLSTTKSDPALVLREDTKGVYYESPIPPTSYGEDLKVNLQRGNVKGSSFAFMVSEEGDTWTEEEDGSIHRVITKGEVFEIGPVTDPAYIQTDANLRSTKNLFEEVQEKGKEQQEQEEQEEGRDLRERELKLRLKKLDLNQKRR